MPEPSNFPALHNMINIVADVDDSGNYPPVPDVNTIIGPNVNWVDHGRYHFAKDTKPFVGFEFDYGGHEMNRWWRMRKPGHQYMAAGAYTYQIPNDWDYAGYTMMEELWKDPGSADHTFRNALNQVVHVIPNSMTGLGSTTFHGKPLSELITNLAALGTVLENHREAMNSAYKELDVPEGPMTGSAASAYAARLYDFALRLRDLKRQVDNNHDALEDILAPIKVKGDNLREKVQQTLNNPTSDMRSILDEWYFGVTTGSEQWNESRSQFQVRLHVDERTGERYGIIGDDPTDAFVNDQLKQRWKKKYEGVIDAAEELYTKMDELYKRAHTELNIIETPKGGIPLSMVPDINDIDNPYDDLFGDGDGNDGPQEIKIDWGDGDGPGGDGPDIPDWLTDPPPGYGDGPGLNYEGPGDGPGGYQGGPDDGWNIGDGDGGPDLDFGEGDPGPGPGDGNNVNSWNGDGLGLNGPGGDGVAPPPPVMSGPPPGLDTNFPGTGDGSLTPPPGMNTAFPGTGDGVAPPPPVMSGPPPGLDTNFPGTGDGSTPPPGGIPGGFVPPPPLGLNGPGGTGGTGGGRRQDGAPLPPPTGLDIDPATGQPLNPDTGRPFPVDPGTGLPFDPDTGLPINYDPDTGRVTPIDPITGEPVSPDGGTRLETDPETGLPLDPDTGRPFPLDPDTGLPFDPDTGLPINYDPDTGRVLPIDPITGEPVSPDPGLPINYDPETGRVLPIDPITGEPVSPDGGTRLDMDPETGLPLNPDTGRPFPVDPGTGLPFDPDTGLPINYDPDTGRVTPIDPNTGLPLPPDSFTPPAFDPGLDTNFPGWGNDDVPLNPVTGEPAELDPRTGIRLPVDPETGEVIRTGFDTPEDFTYPPRFESGGPDGLNYGGFGGDTSSSDGPNGAPDPADRSSMFAAPTQAGGGQTQVAGGGPGTSGLGGAGGVGGAGQAGMPGAPMMPPMMPPGGMGGGGAGENRDRNRTTWLSEDEKVWGTDKNQQKTVLGRPAPGQPKKGASRHEFVDAGADGSGTGTSSHDDAGTRGRKRKPGIGNRRGRGQEQAGGGDGGRDGSTD
ncbi:YML083C domain-containing protein [Nocardiopsis lambiniae]|uniref:Uncharacterized protein n=1 Tax=Nocardiopsis lambiniae TaxID=3075539 RepID=A0ABU2MF28_9ACTN|nr:hypothetical protein [Nocardiopsis sp. DSM 44743]MDT0331167.1 hypothetical protein [Nocardiopsis sp. DSM 44743]